MSFQKTKARIAQRALPIVPKFSDNLVGNLAVCLFAISGIAFYTLFDSKYTNGFLLFDLIAGSIYSLVLMSFAFISLNKHLKLSILH